MRSHQHCLWCLQQWKQSNWQCRGKPIWAATLRQNTATQVENLAVKVLHTDAHIAESQATEEYQEVEQTTKIEVAQVDLDWPQKDEFIYTLVGQ